MKPCIHLDYETTFTDCELRDCSPHFPAVLYWLRGERWTDNGTGQSPNPSKVQFCKLRGRINEIFACYNGELSCYNPKADAEKGE